MARAHEAFWHPTGAATTELPHGGLVDELDEEVRTLGLRAAAYQQLAGR